MKRTILPIIISVITLTSIQHVCAQEEGNGLKLNATADFVSRYIWRGTDFGNSPSIQPTFSLSKGAFELGYWGAFATNSNYTECDLYLKSTFNGFSVILTDYYIPSATTPLNDLRYLVFKDNNTVNIDTLTGNPTNFLTTHSIEGTLQYKGPENFPVSILVATFLYGNDKTIKDTLFTPSGNIKGFNFRNEYSTYIELGYSLKIKEQPLDIFLGFTPKASIYSTPLYSGELAVVNCGITGYRTIDITDKFSLPVKASLICNPQASAFYFVFGLTL